MLIKEYMKRLINESVSTLGKSSIFFLCFVCWIFFAVWFQCHGLLAADSEFLEEFLEVSGHNDICAVAWASLLPYAAELVSSSLLLTLCQDATSHVLESSLVLLGTSARPCDSRRKAVLWCCFISSLCACFVTYFRCMHGYITTNCNSKQLSVVLMKFSWSWKQCY